MDLSGVIDSFSLSYVVTRPAASTYTAGRLDTPSTSTFSIDACAQPVTGRDLQRLPEGTRVADVKSVYTATELRMSDSISIDGSSYEVQHVDRWAELGGYWKVIALKTGN